MSTTVINLTIQLRRGFAAEWTSSNPVLAAGEPGVELDTLRLKLGDGGTPWNSLPYILDEDAVQAMIDAAIANGGGGGAPGQDGAGWTGGSYDPLTGVVTFSSDDGLDFVTGDLRGAPGNDGSDGNDGPTGPKGDGWTGGSYNSTTGIVTFTSDDGLGFLTGDLRGPAGESSPTITILGSATYETIIAQSNPQINGMWIQTNAGGGGLAGDGLIWDGITWNNVGPVRGPQGLKGDKGDIGLTGQTGSPGPIGPPGPDGADGDNGLGWTGGSYNPTTGVVTFTSNDGLGFSTTSLKGTNGVDGIDGTNGIDGNDGAPGPKGDPGNDGTDGLGWTGGAYNPATGVVTFTSDDGLGFSTTDLRGQTGSAGSIGPAGADGIDGNDGADGLGWTSGSYDSETGQVSFASDDGLGFTTGDLRGGTGPAGNAGPQGPQGVSATAMVQALDAGWVEADGVPSGSVVGTMLFKRRDVP